MSTSSKILPFLWFDDNAEEAFRFYAAVFPDTRVTSVSPMIVHALVGGQEVMALNGGPAHKLNESFSFFVECEDQAEVDRYWDALVAGGATPIRCGWITDRFGLTWQIIPKLLGELMYDDDSAKADRVMQAMLQMVKIDSTALQRAYDGT
jgi:predicted 3-demethylubiquinone-9 3-methyltransferase (glyoxalase superfamily)